MSEALEIWKRYPKQIATGLRSEYPGAHIRQWHRGEMSSLEFMELVEGLPGDSWFKSALNADLARAKAEAERSEMYAAHTKVRSYLMGEDRIPHAMSLSVIEKHTLAE